MGGGSPAPAPPPPAPDYSSQFAGLRSGQDTIRSDIKASEDVFMDESRELSREMAGGFADVNNNFLGVNSGIRGVQDTVDDGFSDVGNQISGLENTVGAYGTQMDSGFRGVNENMNTGFNNLGTQVDARVGELGANMGTAFDAQNNLIGTGFTGLGDMVTTGNQAVLEGQQEGFNNVNQNVSNVGANLGNQLTETSENVMAGQANIADLVAQYGGNLDNYYAALAQGQSESAARQAAMQTGLDQFRDDFDRSSTVAEQQRGRIQDAVVGGTSQLADVIASGQDTTQQRLSNVRAGVSDVQSAMQNQAAQTTKDFADVARKITVGFNDGTQQSQNLRGEFIDRLNTVRTVLADQTLRIDNNVRQSFQTLSNSFDETGRLISNSTAQNGNQISRAIDNQGNLLLSAFDPSGRRVESASVNINQMMSQMDRLGYVAGTNTMMGQAMGGPAQVYSGLGSPYSATR